MRPNGLADAAAGALLDTQAPDLTSAVRELLMEQAEGNPLALVELPRLLSEDKLGGGSPLPPPLTQRLERVFAAEATELPAPAHTLLVLAAANDEDAAAATLGEGRSVGWAMIRRHPKELG